MNFVALSGPGNGVQIISDSSAIGLDGGRVVPSERKRMLADSTEEEFRVREMIEVLLDLRGVTPLDAGSNKSVNVQGRDLLHRRDAGCLERSDCSNS